MKQSWRLTLAATVMVGVGLFGMGLAVGQWDVAQNVEGAAVERLVGRSIMSRFHASFSVGTVVGALVGALAAAPADPLYLQLAGQTAAELAGGTASALRRAISRGSRNGAPSLPTKPKPLLRPVSRSVMMRALATSP